MLWSLWIFVTSKSDSPQLYELISMSSNGEAISAEPDKNRSLVDEDSRSSMSSDDDVQAGVKNIEIVSQTWSKWALVSAYFG